MGILKKCSGRSTVASSSQSTNRTWAFWSWFRKGFFLCLGGQVIGGDDSDPFAGGFSGVGKDAVVGLEFADEGVDRAGRVCGPFFVIGQEGFDLFEREVS